MKMDTRKRLENMIQTVEEAYALCNLVYQLYSQDPERTADMAGVASLQRSLLGHLRELTRELNNPLPLCPAAQPRFQYALTRLLAGTGVTIHSDEEKNKRKLRLN
jgi:hypothetical protein